MSKARGLADLGNVYNDGALSNRNLIINGAMQVAQRGTSFAAIGAATYTLDRWRGQSRASSVINVSKVDNLDVSGRIMSALQHEVTTAASDGLTLQNQIVEDGSISLLGQTVVVSCWARVTVGSASLEQQFEVDGGTYTFTSASTTLTTSFQRITFTTTLSGYTTAIADKNLRYQVYIRGALAHTVQITGVQLEVGDTATPFEHRSYGQELAQCQRYYEAIPVIHNLTMARYSQGAGNSNTYIKSTVTMRSAPSVTVSGTFSSAAGFAGTPTVGTTSTNGFQVIGATSRTAGYVEYLQSNSTPFTLDAEL